MKKPIPAPVIASIFGVVALLIIIFMIRSFKEPDTSAVLPGDYKLEPGDIKKPNIKKP